MQRRGEKLLQELGRDQNIRRLVLFGSSLEFRCNSASDIIVIILCLKRRSNAMMYQVLYGEKEEETVRRMFPGS